MCLIEIAALISTAECKSADITCNRVADSTCCKAKSRVNHLLCRRILMRSYNVSEEDLATFVSIDDEFDRRKT